jgi:hypothetical protein
MDPMEFLRRVWSKQGEGVGFICSRRSNTSWFEKAVSYPRELSAFELERYADGDNYFSPNLYGSRTRRRNNVLPSRWLYADLDGVDPSGLDGKLRPTVAWSTSEGRYQAMWLTQPLERATHERLNKQLTYLVGADKSGWDATQVLRIPGTKNYKYESEPIVELLWFNDGVRKIQGSGMEVPEDTGGGVFRVAELGGKEVPAWIRQRLRTQVPAGDRSRVLFKMELDLLSKGWSKAEVFTLLRSSVWNKFDDRRLSDDIRRAAKRVGR